jgi:hypothetical protein
MAMLTMTTMVAVVAAPPVSGVVSVPVDRAGFPVFPEVVGINYCIKRGVE